MFTRYADFQITAWYDGSNIQDLKSDWSKVVHSGHVCKDGSCPFITQKSFDYDPENFLYFRCRAQTADIPNGNGDMFPLEEIKAAYRSFVGKGVYYNHNSDNPDNAFGLVLDAVLHTDATPAYVELLCALDKVIAEEKHPGMLRKVQSGMLNSTSMSCIAQEAECGICHNRAKNTQELCAHMNPESPNFVKGRKASSGSINFEINYGLTYTEDSIVNVPADHTARIFQCWASLNKSASLEQLIEKLQELSELCQHLE